jgi:hypothetical protein
MKRGRFTEEQIIGVLPDLVEPVEWAVGSTDEEPEEISEGD